MLTAARDMKANDRIDEIEIAAVPLCGAEYAQKVQSRYYHKLSSFTGEPPEVMLEGEEAANAMKSLFRAKG